MDHLDLNGHTARRLNKYFRTEQEGSWKIEVQYSNLTEGMSVIVAVA